MIKSVACYEAKYPKAMNCLTKDRDEMLAFYDFPAEHWVHIRTTNPIKSTFATLRLRTKRSKSCGSRNTTLAMVFKLMQTARKKWRRFKGLGKLTLVINNVLFVDGNEVKDDWPIVATALVLDTAIWTADKDFFGSGMPTWTTDRIYIFF